MTQTVPLDLAETANASEDEDEDEDESQGSTHTLPDMNLSGATASEGRTRFRPGELLDRYLVIDKIAAGGMGVVFAAYDPKLDRKIALKLLVGGDSKNARERLQREAKALARLGHPNVVGVFDVGTHAGQLFVAKEFVAGQTLGECMRSDLSPRPWKDVLAVFMAAGRGLAAAHGAELIHRDFKPDNVMLGNDGRVRVMDFGLARAVQGDDDEAGLSHAQHERVNQLTQTGAMMGTPAYMPLEQFHGRDVDARSDQFSFGLALYEALYGERPFPGATLPELLEALEAEQIRKPPAGTSVPTWLREVVVRALAKDPARRWPSMQALLDALAADPVPRRRRRLATGALLASLAVGVGWVYAALQADAGFCKHVEDKLVGAWDEERRVAVEQAILGTKLAYAPDTWQRVEQHLDAYAEAWVLAREQACEATQHGEQSGELLDLRMACLDERRLHLQATVDELMRPEGVEKAVQAVLALPGLERCADVEALTAEIPPPEDTAVAERVAALDEQLVAAKAKQEAGHYDEALALADSVVTEGITLDYEPLMARAWLRQGSVQSKKARHDEAVATLRLALDAAMVLGMRTEAASASTNLVWVVGYQQARPDEARRWIELSETLVRAAATTEARAARFYILGAVAWTDGKYEEARDHHTRALAIQEQTLGSDHPDVANSLNELGMVALVTGDFDAGRKYFERALSILENALGPDHPDVATSVANLGIAADCEKRYADAREYFERALAIRMSALGPDHPLVAASLTNLALVAEAEENYQEAEEYFERGRAIYEKVLGPEHPEVAKVYQNMGIVAHKAGKLEEARDHQSRAVAIYAKTALSAEHPGVKEALVYLAITLLDLGRPVEAIPHLERALTMTHLDGPPDLARTRFALARALWDAPEQQGRDRARARELAELARTTYAETDSPDALHEVETWLSEHPHN